MHRHTASYIVHAMSYTAHAILRIALVLVILLAMLPVPVSRAQDGEAPPVEELPPSLIEQLEKAPRLEPAPAHPEADPFATAPDGMTQLPDRTKYAVLDYRVEGDTVHAVVQLPATKSTFIASGRPTQNFAGATNVDIGWDQQTYNAMRVLVQFDLGPLPSNARINNATFYAYQSYINPPGDGSAMAFRAQFMQQSWSESSVNWNNANYLGGQSLPLGDLPPVTGWITGGATDAVKAWDTGTSNHGLILTGDETPNLGRWRQLSSRVIASEAPYLRVDYSASCDTAAPVSTMGALPTYEPNEFRASWSAYDPDQPGCRASGVAWYNVRYRINGGSWHDWKNKSTSTSNHFRGWAPNNALVEFQVQAADNAGNLGNWSPTVSTRVDSEAPVASVNPLPQYTVNPSFTVTWSGTDNLSGIAYYNFQVSKNDSSWMTVLEETTSTSFQVTGGQQGDKYEFRVQAVDNVGNIQPWSPNAQASTTIFDHPVAAVNPFDPAVIKPTSPTTNVIPISWGVTVAPGTSIVQYEVRYRYTSFAGATTNWLQWRVFTGNPPVQDAIFDYASLGHGNGLYEFFVMATANQGQPQPFDPSSGKGGSVILDLDDVIQPQAYLPVIHSSIAPD